MAEARTRVRGRGGRNAGRGVGGGAGGGAGGGWRRLGVARADAGPASRAPYGWAPAVVMFLVALVDRIEYSLLPAVLVPLQEEWGFGDTVAGSIPTASALAAMLLALPAGALADRADRTRVVVVVVLAWSLATLGSALAGGLAVFYVIRVLLASAEAVDNPAAGSLLADWYPGPSRAAVFGWWRIAGYLGGVGLMVGGVLAQLLGWRGVFVVMTIPGLLVALLASLLREPPRGHVDRMAAAHALGGGEPPPSADPGHDGRSLRERCRDTLRVRTLRGTGAALAVTSFAVGAIVYWSPTFLQRAYGLEEAGAGTLAGGVSLLGVVGGALTASRLAKRPRGGSAAEWSVLLGSAGLVLGSAFMALSLVLTSWQGFSIGVLLFAYFSAFAIPTLTACVADVIPAADRGTGFGLLQVAATIGGAIGPFAVGALSDAAGSLRTAFWLTVPLLLVSGLFALTARRSVDADTRAALHASLRRR